MNRDARLVAALTALAGLRLIAGALLPLSADEAYYWLWSRHLAAGYFDHPPAIAFVIRAGTLLFGDTAFGVRIGSILLSFAAGWFVWRAAAIVSASEKAGAWACLFFNLTLLVSVEALAATPDAPSIATSAAVFWALAKVGESNDGRWWLAVGAASGLALLSKYTGLFLGVGILVWLMARQRRWLATPWPYLGGALALVLFAPNLLWNASHGWETFAFQLGRITSGSLTARFLFEFLGAQLLLASPFVLLLGVLTLAGAPDRPGRALIASLLWPSIAYFVIHSLHDRVQGNWPCFLYPVLAAAAADAVVRRDWQGIKARLALWSSKLAAPVAAALLVAGYAQALVGVVPMGRKDPLARLLAVGMPQVTATLDALRLRQHAGAILTTDYATTGWFAFYDKAPVVQLGEDYRWDSAPVASPALFARPALYVAELRRDRADVVRAYFGKVTLVARIDRERGGIPIAHYVVYRVEGPRTPAGGHQP
ncbi:MAG: glycosyltransferase family 39 protein [Alphaproteobacteria bacterium]|nr:glycosyltransferase family 39 protein [Alphaproteobacteria bacterium]